MNTVKAKGSHQRAAEDPTMADECPVCLDAFPTNAVTKARLAVRSFQCDHLLCRTCDGKVRQSEDHRCPTCRSPRKGMTTEQAEPRTDRNAPDPQQVYQDHIHAVQANQGSQAIQGLSTIAGVYGVPPHLLPPLLRAAELHEQQSQHSAYHQTMFFPVVPVEHFDPFEGAPDRADGLPHEPIINNRLLQWADHVNNAGQGEGEGEDNEDNGNNEDERGFHRQVTQALQTTDGELHRRVVQVLQTDEMNSIRNLIGALVNIPNQSASISRWNNLASTARRRNAQRRSARP